jgi:hypothetical protein
MTLSEKIAEEAITEPLRDELETSTHNRRKPSYEKKPKAVPHYMQSIHNQKKADPIRELE